MKSRISWALWVACLPGLGCSTATSAERPDTWDGSGGAGGDPAATDDGGGGGGGGGFPCGVDCSLIEAPQCFTPICDAAERRCALVPIAGGEAAPCDDKDACTVGETCDDGVCRGGVQNDCGLTPDACHAVACAEVGGAPVRDARPLCHQRDLPGRRLQRGRARLLFLPRARLLPRGPVQSGNGAVRGGAGQRRGAVLGLGRSVHGRQDVRGRSLRRRRVQGLQRARRRVQRRRVRPRLGQLLC
jgi:hypothetical protein